mmetsp:Transcript_1991/g.4316  ORF Transcript_1991/g.4316 Transcript_1991/m.4316 type:complete len:262 (-) Transcript_1991:965-1750(-)
MKGRPRTLTLLPAEKMVGTAASVWFPTSPPRWGAHASTGRVAAIPGRNVTVRAGRASRYVRGTCSRPSSADHVPRVAAASAARTCGSASVILSLPVSSRNSAPASGRVASPSRTDSRAWRRLCGAAKGADGARAYSAGSGLKTTALAPCARARSSRTGVCVWWRKEELNPTPTFAQTRSTSGTVRRSAPKWSRAGRVATTVCGVSSAAVGAASSSTSRAATAWVKKRLWSPWSKHIEQTLVPFRVPASITPAGHGWSGRSV